MKLDTNEGTILELAAGTSTKAPLKLTAGTVLATAVAGVIGYATATPDDLTFTIGTGPARKKIVLDNGTDLVTGRIPFTSTNGRLVSDASLSYDTVIGLTSTKPINAPMAHATLSSAITQGVVSTTVAYPLLFESTDDILSMYNASRTFTVNNSGGAACTITCASPHLLTAGAAVIFNPLVGGTGITQGTVYYVSATNLAASTFEIATTYLGATLVQTSATGSGTVTCVSRIYAAEAGDYLFTLSSVLNTTNNSAATMDVWFVQGNSTNNTGGTNIVKSNTQTAIDSNGTQTVVCVPIILDLVVGDFIRLDYRGSTNTIQWLAIGTQTNPTRPAMPSVILTATRIGA